MFQQSIIQHSLQKLRQRQMLVNNKNDNTDIIHKAWRTRCDFSRPIKIVWLKLTKSLCVRCHFYPIFVARF
jgi:hypothetical protein